MIQLAESKREIFLHTQLTQNVHLVHFEQSRIILRLTPQAPLDIPIKLKNFLSLTTHEMWTVDTSNDEGYPTQAMEESMIFQEKISSLSSEPVVQLILDTFPGAVVEQLD